MIRVVSTLLLTLIVAGCHEDGFIDRVAPNTAQGFRAGGLVGGAAAMSGQVLVQCERLDGTEITVAVDGFAENISAETAVDRVRGWRKQACETVGAIDPLLSAVAPEESPEPPAAPKG